VAKYNWMKVVDVMTKEPLTIAPSETVGEAEELMAENGIRQLPVVENRELVGIITDRDVRSFLAGGSSLSAANEREQSLGTKVSDLMTTDPLTVTPTETIGQADELMNTKRIRQLPVVEGKELVGIVTDRDIRSFLSGSLLEGPEEREKALTAKVSEIMTTEPFTVSPEDDLEEAVELLIEEKFGGIPVVDKSAGLVGIVTYVDVLRCFLNRLQENY